jgi:hypothetical protein
MARDYSGSPLFSWIVSPQLFLAQAGISVLALRRLRVYTCSVVGIRADETLIVAKKY